MSKHKRGLSHEETEVLEMVRAISHIPLKTIKDVLESLGTALSVKYANALVKEEMGEDDLTLPIPYVGALRLSSSQNDTSIEWSKTSLILKSLLDVRSAVRDDDTSLLDMWRSRLETDLREKL